MKKVILMVVVLGMFTGCQPQSRKNGGGVLLDPVREYEVDGWGSNPDIYEFTPVGHPSKTCLILVSGGDQAGGIACFDKVGG